MESWGHLRRFAGRSRVAGELATSDTHQAGTGIEVCQQFHIGDESDTDDSTCCWTVIGGVATEAAELPLHCCSGPILITDLLTGDAQAFFQEGEGTNEETISVETCCEAHLKSETCVQGPFGDEEADCGSQV